MPQNDTQTTGTFFELTPISYEDMGEIKKKDIEKIGTPLFGYPAFFCRESGELYPLPTLGCTLHVKAN